MVPKVAARGASFKGAGAYYLHDKKAGTSERVAFTHTENLPVTDPELALDCMAYTAMHQNEIKAASGAARTGRKLTLPVYTYSLSWAPDEEPTRAQMIEAGLESLKALRLEEHEVLMVAHNDMAHPHLHLIVNRVHPETGKAATLPNDHLILSRWAEAYEKRQGKIRCEQRVENNEARRRGAFAKDRRSLNAAAFHRWRRQRLRGAYAVRQATAANLSAYHQGQRQALYDEKEQRIRQYRQEVAARNRPHWAALYARHKAERRELAVFQASPVSRLAYWLRNRDLGGRAGSVVGALAALTGRHGHAGELAVRQERERAALSREIRRETLTGIRDINRRYHRELTKMKDGQAQERYELSAAQSRQSQELAREIRERRDEERFLQERGPSLGDEFARRVQERIKDVRKRHKEEKERNRGGGRERD
jgi:gas vesicle protein